MRRIEMALLTALATIAAIGMTVVGPMALAQQAQTAGPVSLGDLFTGPDSTDLRPGAKEKVVEAVPALISRAPDCPMQATFTVVVRQGDPIFQEAVANARLDVIKQVISDGALVRLHTFETKVGGQVDDVRVDYEPRQDKESPKLDTNSTPPKGTKVKAGDRITVTMIARDNANRWQTGIRAIQLIAESDGNRFVGAEHYTQILPRCAAVPPEKRLQATYIVPANPPPIVRLAALAEDHAGLMDTDVGEFPTGEMWKGTAEVTSSTVYPAPDNPTCRDGWRLNFTFVASSEGTIKGEGTAELTSGPTCPFMVAGAIMAPSWKQVEYKVLGEKTAGGFSLRFAFVKASGGVATGAGFTSMFGFLRPPSGGPAVVVAVSGTSGTGQGVWTFQSGNPPATYSANGGITIECVTCERP